MALRHVVVEGDPILRKKCRIVPEINDRIRELADDMVETLIDNEGVGIAAPQVGMLKRLCVIMPDPEKPEEYTVMINPQITLKEGDQASYEGCLSVPNLIGLVHRPAHIQVKYTDLDGSENVRDLEGFEAIVASHEIDHLDGVLYIDKATDIHHPEEDRQEQAAAEDKKPAAR